MSKRVVGILMTAAVCVGVLVVYSRTTWLNFLVGD